MSGQPVRFATLEDLKNACLSCRSCGLAQARQKVVFGEGNTRAEIFLLGEAPGAREDETGRPFVGRAGEVLNQLLVQAGFAREELFITGSCKCRPPQNRNPRRHELAACRYWLDAQLAFVRPRVVVCLGLVAVHNLLGTGARMKDVRGRWFHGPSYRIFPTYHPAAVLRGTVEAEVLVEDFRTVALQLF